MLPAVGRILVACASAVLASCALLAPFDSDGGEGEGEECSTGDLGANGGCDWTCNDPAAPALDMTILQASKPDGLATDSSRVLVAVAIQVGVLNWLIDVGPDGAFRTGSGTCERASRCAFDQDPPPASGFASVGAESGVLRLPASGTVDLDLGLRLLEIDDVPILPLREMVIVGQLENDGNCVGRWVGEAWQPGGQVRAKIPVEETKDIYIEALASTLCDALAGSDCNDGDPLDYRRPADTTIGAEPAWVLEADFAAIGVQIE